jgi:hypothetical protein
MSNEIANVQENQVAQVIRENNDYVVVKDAEGKFKRKAKYNLYSSIKPESRADKIWLANLMEGTEDTGNGLKDHVGKVIEVADIITRPYDKINEETGETEYGVLTYLITPDRVAYVTSSKSVYFSIVRNMELLGSPTDENWENLMIQAYKERGTNGDMIKIKVVG